tara:strand:+ start:188 stop:463 length:276 start_codon:yes stop_codon:yes gene_type:complete
MSLYCKIKNHGKGFITAENRFAFEISGHPNDTWVVEDNAAGQRWIDDQKADPFANKAAAQTALDASIAGQLYPDDYDDVSLRGQQVTYTLP